MRLAVFVDQIFWRDGNVLSTDESYILFPASFVSSVDEVVFIGREAPERKRAPYILDSSAISLCAMPYYKNLYTLWRSDPRMYATARAIIRREAPSWDALMVSGPNPLGQMAARECIALGIPVFLLVRQNLIQQMSAHRGVKRWIAMAAAHTLEWDFKRLARGRTVFTVGQEMAEAYGRFSQRVYNHFPCLVDEEQFRTFSAMSAGADSTRLLSVCRLAPEKGHRYLFDALIQLKKIGILCNLDIVGTGPLDQELRSMVQALGLDKQVTFHGYVPYGPQLFGLYQRAGMLVLPSLTEGFPQVINESLSIGLPTVATRVGGIPSFLTDGDTAMLIPPADVGALAGAIEQVISNRELRTRLRENGRTLMRNNTLEANRSRIMRIINDELTSIQV